MRRVFLLLAVGLLLTGCGGDDESSSSEETQGAPLKTVTINETEYKLDPASVSVDKAGTYSFEVVNKGQVAHALEVEGQGVEEETETIDPGARATLTVELEDGSYELYCPIDGHKDKGMEGELEVAGGSSGNGY